MADYQIGDNLWADTQGKYYNWTNGAKSYVESPFDAMSGKINSLYDTQKKNQIDQLNAQRQKAIAGFNQQKNDLKPVYQNQRNQADVVNAQNVSRLRELMAANGINASGENLTTQAKMASDRQNAFSEINNNEQYAVREIDRQIANENDPAREQAINNEIEFARSRALLDAYNQAQADIMRMYQEWQAEQERKKAAAAAARKSASSSSKTTSIPESVKPAAQSYDQYAFERAMLPDPINNASMLRGTRPVF